MFLLGTDDVAIRNTRWNLALTFRPPPDVAFQGTALKFAIGSVAKDNRQIGFRPPGDWTPGAE